VSLPLLPSGARDIRILHFSDLHLTPARKREIADIKSWAALKPDLVISTGDFLAHRDGVEVALNALNELLDLPGLYVFGSNDYYGPRFKNPLSYRGWINLNNNKSSITINGLTIDIRGTDDAHLELDDYERVAGEKCSDLAIGVTHAPYSRVLDAMSRDKLDLIFAGHTHGGQVRIPWFGGSRSITTNCDLPNWRSRGLTKLPNQPHLNVSAGMGFSPYAPLRFFCPPEISLIRLFANN
jgi:predicted MPP superfamily phosphohydrolase